MKNIQPNNVFFITEEEKLQILRNRMETERRLNRNKNRFFKRETILQKIIAILIFIGSIIVSISTQECIAVVVLLFCIPAFLINENIFK